MHINVCVPSKLKVRAGGIREGTEVPLSIAAGPTKHHHGISCQFIQDADKIAVFILAGYKEVVL